MGAAQSALEPCVRCLKPFTPSAADLHEAAGYQPVSTQPSQAHTAPQPHTAAAHHASSASAAAGADSAEDSTDWEEFEDFDQEQDRLDRIEKSYSNSQTAASNEPATAAAALSSSSSSSSSSASVSHNTSPPTSNRSSLSSLQPSHSPPRPSAATSRPSPPPPAIDFFGSVGLTSSGYQEPVRLQTKPRPHSAQLPAVSPELSASQRADVMREYGLDDVGVDVASWDDGLSELDMESSGGEGGGKKKGKKKGLGAVAVMDEV